MRKSVVASAAALAVLLAGCGREPSAEAPGAAATAPSRSSRRPATVKPRDSATVDLEALAADTPEYLERGRNLFAFGRAPAPAGGASPPAPAVPAPPPIPVESRPAPAAPRIDLKFAGYVEKPYPDGKKVKYAIFLDGQEVLTGAQGEVVANRYRIVEIGLESVTLAPTGSNTTQRIPLKAN